MVYYSLIILFLVWLAYTVLPNYFARQLSKKVLKKIRINNGQKNIALTFDDGPDENYTMRLLDILGKHYVKATFFLVAEKAYKNKNIVERMKREGHNIAMHSLKHKSAWLSFPWETKREFEKSLKIFREIGVDIKHFRPPWGTFNAVTLKYATKHRLRVILWTVEAYDWRKDNTPKHIEKILIDRTKNGDIIVLHDSGGAKGAPENTLKALESTISRLLDKGFHFVTIDEGIGETL